ncbi:hypothetical protein ACV1EK_14155 [Klebsiella pneumoniae]
MHSLLAKVMERGIFRVPARRKRKVEVKPSDIPTFHYTASDKSGSVARVATPLSLSGAGP